jgi:hypothetical protein
VVVVAVAAAAVAAAAARARGAHATPTTPTTPTPTTARAIGGARRATRDGATLHTTQHLLVTCYLKYLAAALSQLATRNTQRDTHCLLLLLPAAAATRRCSSSSVPVWWAAVWAVGCFIREVYIIAHRALASTQHPAPSTQHPSTKNNPPPPHTHTPKPPSESPRLCPRPGPPVQGCCRRLRSSPPSPAGLVLRFSPLTGCDLAAGDPLVCAAGR